MTNPYQSSNVQVDERKLNKSNNNALPYAVSAIAGLLVCFAITLISGRREAWDSRAYFVVGIPLMCAVNIALSYNFPKGAWRWTIAMAVGQSVAMVWGHVAADGFRPGTFALWPLSLIAMTVLSIPQFASGWVASWLSRKLKPGDDPK